MSVSVSAPLWGVDALRCSPSEDWLRCGFQSESLSPNCDERCRIRRSCRDAISMTSLVALVLSAVNRLSRSCRWPASSTLRIMISLSASLSASFSSICIMAPSSLLCISSITSSARALPLRLLHRSGHIGLFWSLGTAGSSGVSDAGLVVDIALSRMPAGLNAFLAPFGDTTRIRVWHQLGSPPIDAMARAPRVRGCHVT
mmetsp:Transcript_6420/g.12454  ORF Transcript_6420/g.12454 Transcript_6420/m.12454 type:complete len:200 (+) Transcript_6420:172-771(+)